MPSESVMQLFSREYSKENNLRLQNHKHVAKYYISSLLQFAVFCKNNGIPNICSVQGAQNLFEMCQNISTLKSYAELNKQNSLYHQLLQGCSKAKTAPTVLTQCSLIIRIQTYILFLEQMSPRKKAKVRGFLKNGIVQFNKRKNLYCSFITSKKQLALDIHGSPIPGTPAYTKICRFSNAQIQDISKPPT